MANTLKTLSIAAVAAVTFGASAIATTSPANAFGYHHGFHGGYGYHHGIGRGAAVGLGIAGAALATGAAVSYYNRPYGYGYGNGYYARPYGYGGY